MQFGILGPLEVTDGGQTVDLGRPKQRAVLAVLLLSANRVVSLDRLIDLLWGDEAPARAAGPLQAYISNLRRVLEPVRAPRTPAQVLVTQPPGYVLRVLPGELDAAVFERLAATGRQQLAEGHPRAALRSLTEALALWRGPALAEFVFEPFAERDASRLEELRVVTTEHRWEAELALGAHSQVVGPLEMAVAEHPLRERLWELLMLALYRSGRQGDALRAYERARKILAEDMGLSPSPELRRLYASVLDQSHVLEWRSVGDDDGPGTAVISEAPVPDSSTKVEPAQPPGPAFVGREPELRVMRGALASCCEGRGRFLLVSGEAGIGKTRLAEELSARAKRAGVPVVWAQGYEAEGAPPFWPWTQVMRSLFDLADPAIVREALGPAAAELVHLVPDIEALLGVKPAAPAVEHPSARFRLYDAICNSLRRVTSGQPMVLVLDDLQWADVPSLDLAVHLGIQLDDIPLLVIGTYRSNSDRTGSLGDALGALARLRTVERIDLRGLSRAATARFLNETTGVEPARSEVEDLHASTNGNPFFLAELSTLWAAEGRPQGRFAMPVGVREVIRSRLDRLPGETNALLIVGAVIGTEFDLRVAAAAGRAELEEALDVVEPAVATGIVAEVPAVPGLYRFSHALVRDAIYGGLGGLRRSRIHAQVAEAIEARPDAATRVAELAFHFEQAAPAVGPERAIVYALRAAEAAHARLAYEAAAGHVQSGLRLVATLPVGPGRDRHELLLRQRAALSATVLGGLAALEAREAWERAAALARQNGDSGALLSSLLGLATCLVVRGDLDSADAIGEELLASAQSRGDEPCAVAGHFTRGTAAWFHGRLEGARHELEAAQTRGAGLNDDALVATFGWNDPAVLGSAMLAVVGWLRGEEGTRHPEAARPVPRSRPNHPLTEAIALIIESCRHAIAEDVLAVRRVAERLDGLSKEHGLRDCQAAAAIFRGWARVVDVDPEGLAELKAGLEGHSSAGFRILRPLYLGLLGDAHRRLGQVAQALTVVQDALAEVEATGERLYEAELLRMHGELLVSLGRQEAGASALERAAVVAREQQAVRFEERALASLARHAASATD